jgi:hypothetical protein
MFKHIPETAHQWSFEPPPADAAAQARDAARSVALLRTLFHLSGGGGGGGLAAGADAASADALGKWGLGAERSYDAWVAFSGVDGARHVSATGAQCGDIHWVPPRSASNAGWGGGAGAAAAAAAAAAGGAAAAFGRRQGVATALEDAADAAFELRNDAFLAAQEHAAIRHN